MHRPLLLEGEAGVGKTEVAKVLSRWTGGELIRLQCYEGIDVSQAVYEWDYSRQLLHLRAAEATGEAAGEATEVLEDQLYTERFLIKRALLRAIDHREGPPPILLIDEVDRADDEFEAFLLEVLSDFQITVPELGTFTASTPPIVVLTSNRTRDVHDALKRRCLYHWVEHPDFEREVAIVRLRAPQIADGLARQVAAAVEAMRGLQLYKPPGVAETIDWAASLGMLGATRLDEDAGRSHPRHGAEVPRGPGARAPARRGRPRQAGVRARWCVAPWLTPRPAVGQRTSCRCADAGQPGNDAVAVSFARVLRVGRAVGADRLRARVRRGPGRGRVDQPRRRLLGRAGNPRAPAGGHRDLRPCVRRLLGAAPARTGGGGGAADHGHPRRRPRRRRRRRATPATANRATTP